MGYIETIDLVRQAGAQQADAGHARGDGYEPRKNNDYGS
jgi:hypothetical protein